MERIDYDLLFRWFVGLETDDPVWSFSTFSKNRERLLSINVDEFFFEAIKQQATSHQLLSHEHFTVPSSSKKEVMTIAVMTASAADG